MDESQPTSSNQQGTITEAIRVAAGPGTDGNNPTGPVHLEGVGDDADPGQGAAVHGEAFQRADFEEMAEAVLLTGDAGLCFLATVGLQRKGYTKSEAKQAVAEVAMDDERLARLKPIVGRLWAKYQLGTKYADELAALAIGAGYIGGFVVLARAEPKQAPAAEVGK